MAFLNAIWDGGFVRVFPVNSTTPGDSVVDLWYHGHIVGHMQTIAGAQSLRSPYADSFMLV